ncbi:MAG: DUF1549 domain-containing protein, partial [Planctomycetes bacterium]|nr:DUF1549 domain-containing protein [Planctomycetota bacterium]
MLYLHFSVTITLLLIIASLVVLLLMTRLSVLVLFAALSSPVNAAEPVVDFNRDVRPILSNNCYACHGPDEKERKARLRLDTFEGAQMKGALVPGEPDESELVLRVESGDADDLMPPAQSGKKLSAKEIATLRTWVQQGGKYATHWSYVKPTRPAPPPVADPTRNAIDNFLFDRLSKEGLKPSPEADKPTLIRRVALALTGLPPTLAEVDQFLADDSPDAYETM